MAPPALRFSVSIGGVSTEDGSSGPVVVHKRGVDLRSAESLRHEREVLGRISHPGVVELARDAETAGPPTLSTYLAGNLTLADRPPSGAASITRTGAQIATTLAELHAAGTTHGSVAPEHCVLGPGGSVVLCSLRRATDVSTPDHPSAVSDVAALVSMLRSWQDAPSRGRRDGARRDGARRDPAATRLISALATAERRTPVARDLALALSGPEPAIGPAPGPVAPRRRDASPHPASERPAAWRPVVALAAPIAAATLLWRIDLPDPAVAVDGLPAAVAATAIALRWIALAACGYLALLGALATAASLTRDERLARTAERLAPGRLRRWAAGLTSVGLLGSAAAATAPLETAPAPRERVEPATTTTAPTTTTTTTTIATAITMPPAPPPIASAAPVPLLATPVGPSAATTWTVRRGDHLWSIAERSLAARLGRPATEDEVRHYWRSLVEANRTRLADPSNPDLIFAGQVVVLPPN